MKQLSVTFTPAAQAPNPTVIYNDVVEWDWDQMLSILQILLEDDVKVFLNTTYVLAVLEKEALEPERPELWDVDDEEDGDDLTRGLANGGT